MKIFKRLFLLYFWQMIIRPKIFNQSIIAAQSTRIGGVSPKPFESLNLGLSVNDEESNVLKNRELFFSSLNITASQVAKSHQVHGTKVLHVKEPLSAEGFDALITGSPNVFLAVSIADCTPILIHDEKNNAVAAIHAGWKGTAGNITGNTLELMNETFGTQGKDCKAFIGACIGYENFEVGIETAANFENEFKRFDASKQKWFVDLKKINKKQLIDFGLLSKNIEVSNYCTVKNSDLFFSHRKEKGTTGRMMAVIGIRK